MVSHRFSNTQSTTQHPRVCGPSPRCSAAAAIPEKPMAHHAGSVHGPLRPRSTRQLQARSLRETPVTAYVFTVSATCHPSALSRSWSVVRCGCGASHEHVIRHRRTSHFVLHYSSLAKTARCRVDSKLSRMIFTAVMIGTASTMPTMPHSRPKTASDNSRIIGLMLSCRPEKRISR